MPDTEIQRDIKMIDFIERFIQRAKHDQLENIRISDTAMMAITGHWLYVRKLQNRDKYTTIVSADDQFCSNWCIILAIGPAVGAKRGWPAGKRKLHEVPLHIDNEFKKGDVVFVPDTFNWTVKQNEFGEEDGDECFFVDEYTPLCRYTEEGIDHGDIK